MTKVAVALSGGVDSSVVAYLLKQQGYEVVGVCAKTTNTLEAEQVVENAKTVANKLEIPFYSLDVTTCFQERIIDYFKASYQKGETPNPCIMCNKYIKWGTLYDYAINELGANFIATGHYAKIKEVGEFSKFYPASDEHKDQLYFLFSIGQEKLKRTMFPLSNYTKEEVRKIAFENDLPSKSSKESQDICFIKPPMTTKKYLLESFGDGLKGHFIQKSTGKVLGTHDGFWQYTIGQRKGIGLAAPEALYVIDIDAQNNIVYVGYKNELSVENLTLKNVNWSYSTTLRGGENVLVKIRYNMKAVEAVINFKDDDILLTFTSPVSGIARGQACVLYDYNDGHLLGGVFM